MAKVKKEVSVITKVITDTSKADAPIKETAKVMKKAGREIEQAAQQAAAAVEKAFSQIRTGFPGMGIRSLRSTGYPASSFGVPVDDFTRRNTASYFTGGTGNLRTDEEKYGRQNLKRRVEKGKREQKQLSAEQKALVRKQEKEERDRVREQKALVRKQEKEERDTARSMGPDMGAYYLRQKNQKELDKLKKIEDKKKERQEKKEREEAISTGPDMDGSLRRAEARAADRRAAKGMNEEDKAMARSHALRTRKERQRIEREARDKEKLQKEKEKEAKKTKTLEERASRKTAQEDKKHATAAERALEKQARLERKAVQSAQVITNRGMGMGQGAMGFMGAALGSTLFAAGGSSGLGAFGAIPGIMASRAFQGAGMGMMAGGTIGSLAGPVGTVIGGGIGALAGGGMGGLMGLLEGSIPAAIGALVDGVKTAIHVLYDGASRLMKAGMEYERQITKFGILTGSPEAGRKLYGGIESLSQKTPYSMGALSTNAELLLGYGVENDNILPTLSRLGDVAGGDAIRLERLGLAFGQVMTQGKLAGQELRQFSEAGVGISDFAQTAGVSTFMFRAMMEQSLIPANVMVETINRLTSSGGRFAGMNEKISETTSGKWNMMMGTLEKYERRLGDFLNRRINAPGILASMTSWIEPASQKIESFIDKAVAWGERGIKALKGPAEYIADIGKGLFENFDISSYTTSWDNLGISITNVAEQMTLVVAKMMDMAKLAKDWGVAIGSSAGKVADATTTPYINAASEYVNPDKRKRGYWGILSDVRKSLWKTPSEEWEDKIKAGDPALAGANTLANAGDGPFTAMAKSAIAQAKQKRENRLNAVVKERTSGPSFGMDKVLNDLGITSAPTSAITKYSSSTISQGTRLIQTKDQPSGQVNAMLDDIVGKMREGFAPLDRFSNTMRVLNEGRWGQPGKPDTASMSRKQFEFGRYEAFQELRKKYEGANKVSFPTGGNERGSEAAARLMLESIEVQINNDMDMMSIMKEAEKDRKKQLKELEDLNKFFETNKDKMTLFIDVAGGP